ncbi:MAG: hypothetical protein ACRDTV_19685, partial [Mycobacterium sp.]
MRALRPYIIAGAALAGASVIVAYPAAPPLPTVQVPAVQPAGSEISGFSQQDLLGMLAETGGLTIAPDSEWLNPPAESPGLGPLPDPAITSPELGPLD